VLISQTTSPNTFVDQTEKSQPKEEQVNQSYASYEGIAQDKYFANLDIASVQDSTVNKLDLVKWEEDKMTTYSEIFEDFQKSEHGSDWHVSNNDPFDIKDIGFPQTLPTSDIGGIFSKHKNISLRNMHKEDSPRSPEPEQKDLTRLIPPILKREVIDANSEDSCESEEEKFLCKYQLADDDKETAAECSSLKPVYDPGFKCLQNQNSIESTNVLDHASVQSPESLDCPVKGAYFYHNEPKF
jgi:hypothetical protein